jgi:hypothetical protein
MSNFPKDSKEIFQLQKNKENKVFQNNDNVKQEDIILIALWEYYLCKNNSKKILLTYGAVPCLIVGIINKEKNLSFLMHLPILESQVKMQNGEGANGDKLYDAVFEKIYQLISAEFISSKGRHDLDFHLYGCQEKGPFDSILHIINEKFSKKFNLNLASFDLNFDEHGNKINQQKSFAIDSSSGEFFNQIEGNISFKIFQNRNTELYCQYITKKDQEKTRKIMDHADYDVLEEAQNLDLYSSEITFSYLTAVLQNSIGL